MIAVRVGGSPVRWFVRAHYAPPGAQSGEAVHGLLRGVGLLRAGTGAETGNVDVRLANESAQCAPLFANRPPLGAPVDIYRAGVLVFSGAVQSVELATECTLQVDA